VSKTSTVTLTVAQATPTITWATPAPVTPGTVLGTAQLNAVATSGGREIAGTYTYLPAAGTVLEAGDYTLTVFFYPSDAVDYAIVSSTVVLNVSGTDFKMTPSAGSTTQITRPGGVATYSFNFAPTDATSVFANDVTFDVIGLPPAWPTPTFKPAKIPAGTVGSQTVTMLVQTGASMGQKSGSQSVAFAGGGLVGVLLIPCLRFKADRRKKTKTLQLILLASGGVSLFLGLTGCGSPSPQIYNLVMTATSGGVTTSASVTLTVQ